MVVWYLDLTSTPILSCLHDGMWSPTGYEPKTRSPTLALGVYDTLPVSARSPTLHPTLLKVPYLNLGLRTQYWFLQ